MSQAGQVSDDTGESSRSASPQYMAQIISLLSLWTTLGGAVGSAASAAMWNQKLPKYLEQQLGDIMNSTQLAEIYGSIAVARVTEPRDQVILGESGLVRTRECLDGNTDY